MVDIALDTSNKICYALTSNGAILGASLSVRSKLKVNFVYVKEKRRKTLVGMMRRKKEEEKVFCTINVSRDGRLLATSSSEKLDDNFVKNEIFLFELKGEDQPEFLTSCEVITCWKGSKKILKLIYLENDFLSHLDLSMTLNQEYLVFGVTMSTGLLFVFLLKNGEELVPLVKNLRIHKSSFI